MKALSIRQPWAWLIVNGHKNVENRSWFVRHQGPLLIHAAKGMTSEEYRDAVDFVRSIGIDVDIPAMEHLERGGIVGIAQAVDCRAHMNKPDTSPWHARGQWGLYLYKPQRLDFRPCRGQLGLFDVDFDALPVGAPTLFSGGAA